MPPQCPRTSSAQGALSLWTAPTVTRPPTAPVTTNPLPISGRSTQTGSHRVALRGRRLASVVCAVRPRGQRPHLALTMAERHSRACCTFYSSCRPSLDIQLSPFFGHRESCSCDIRERVTCLPSHFWVYAWRSWGHTVAARSPQRPPRGRAPAARLWPPWLCFPASALAASHARGLESVSIHTWPKSAH